MHGYANAESHFLIGNAAGDGMKSLLKYAFSVTC